VDGSLSGLSEAALENPRVAPVCSRLVLFPPLLLAQPLARKRLLGAALFSWLHIVTVLFDFFDDVFLLHLALEPAQGIFQGLTFLNANLSQSVLTVLP